MSSALWTFWHSRISKRSMRRSGVDKLISSQSLISFSSFITSSHYHLVAFLSKDRGKLKDIFFFPKTSLLASFRFGLVTFILSKDILCLSRKNHTLIIESHLVYQIAETFSIRTRQESWQINDCHDCSSCRNQNGRNEKENPRATRTNPLTKPK